GIKLAKRGDHLVQDFGHLAELIAAPQRQLPVEITGRYCSRRGHQLTDRALKGSREIVAQGASTDDKNQSQPEGNQGDDPRLRSGSLDRAGDPLRRDLVQSIQQFLLLGASRQVLIEIYSLGLRRFLSLDGREYLLFEPVECGVVEILDPLQCVQE